MAEYTKYQKKQLYFSTDNGVTWKPYSPPIYRQGEIIETNSIDCGYFEPQYRWHGNDVNDYVCSNFNKYYIEYYQVSNDGGKTWANVEPLQTRTGNLIEANSYDCDYGVSWGIVEGEYICELSSIVYRWQADGEMCDGSASYVREIYQISYDDGKTWKNAEPYQERTGALIMNPSPNCSSFEFDWFFQGNYNNIDCEMYMELTYSYKNDNNLWIPVEPLTTKINNVSKVIDKKIQSTDSTYEEIEYDITVLKQCVTKTDIKPIIFYFNDDNLNIKLLNYNGTIYNQYNFDITDIKGNIYANLAYIDSVYFDGNNIYTFSHFFKVEGSVESTLNVVVYNISNFKYTLYPITYEIAKAKCYYVDDKYIYFLNSVYDYKNKKEVHNLSTEGFSEYYINDKLEFLYYIPINPETHGITTYEQVKIFNTNLGVNLIYDASKFCSEYFLNKGGRLSRYGIMTFGYDDEKDGEYIIYLNNNRFIFDTEFIIADFIIIDGNTCYTYRDRKSTLGITKYKIV
jgi:hypothetical protein